MSQRFALLHVSSLIAASLVALSACAFAACSSADASSTDGDSATPVPTPDASDDTSTGARADATPVADARTDAVEDAALAKGEGTTVETSMTEASCSAVCAAKKYECGSTTCEAIDGTLGVVAYMGGTSMNLSSCADVPAPTSGGASFVREDCCCVTPFLIVKGPTPTKSCNDVCAGQSLTCDDKHDWGKAGVGGMDAQYERPSTTAVTDQADTCTKVATATISLTKPTEKGQLTHYSCACVAPAL